MTRLYGRISYSFYLLHPLALWGANRLTVYSIARFETVPVTLIVVAAFVFSVISVTPLAWLSWKFVELPAMNRLRRGRHPTTTCGSAYPAINA